MWGNISHKSETGKFFWDESDIPFIYFILDNVSESTHESFWTLAKSFFRHGYQIYLLFSIGKFVAHWYQVCLELSFS